MPTQIRKASARGGGGPVIEISAIDRTKGSSGPGWNDENKGANGVAAKMIDASSSREAATKKRVRFRTRTNRLNNSERAGPPGNP